MGHKCVLRCNALNMSLVVTRTPNHIQMQCFTNYD